MHNILITEDGFLFEQMPNGWYTDGDVEFDYNNTDIFGLVWQLMGDFYCADGDGIVTVDANTFELSDQGDVVAKFDNLRGALFAAQKYLAATYHDIYEANIE